MAKRNVAAEGSAQPGNRKATITDVARLAGVSKTLVSFVLNGRTDVGDETRHRIEAVIAELGFRPNRQAQLLVKQRVGVVGLMLEVRSNTDLLMLRFVAALGEHLATLGYGLLLMVSANKTPLQAMADVVDEHLVDGLILMDIVANDPRVTWLNGRGVPYLLYSADEADRIHCVDIDYDAAARQIAAYLVKRGRRQVGILGDQPTGLSNVRRREESFRRAAAAAGLEILPEHCFQGDLTERSGWEAGTELAALASRPCALVAMTDLMAMGAIRALQSQGLRVPGDIGVVGFGNSPSAVGVHPALTTVNIPIAEMGRLAAHGILARIDGKECGPWILQPELIERESL